MAATVLNVILEASIKIDAELTADFGNTKQSFLEGYSGKTTVGTGTDEADQYWSDERTLGAGANESLDLNDGSLTNGLGQSVTLDEVKGIYIENTSTTGDMLVGGAAANAFDAIFGDVAASKVRILREDVLVLGGKSGSGSYTVDGTHKVLKIENEDGSNTLTYNIIISGVD